MRKRRIGTALLLGGSWRLGHQFSQADQAIVEAARVRYDSLQEKSLVSLAYTVQFDTTTVPLLPLPGTQRRTF